MDGWMDGWMNEWMDGWMHCKTERADLAPKMGPKR